MKSEIRRLRDELSAEDQLVLVLRVDKGLEWRDIAMALADQDLDDPALARESARLRKRLQLATARLRELATERGLLESILDAASESVAYGRAHEAADEPGRPRGPPRDPEPRASSLNARPGLARTGSSRSRGRARTRRHHRPAGRLRGCRSS